MRYIFYMFLIGTIVFVLIALGFGFLLAHYLQESQPLNTPSDSGSQVVSRGYLSAEYSPKAMTPTPNLVATTTQSLTYIRATQEAIAAHATQTSIAIELAQKQAEAHATRAQLSKEQVVAAARAEATLTAVKSHSQLTDTAVENPDQMGLLSFIGGLGALILALCVLLLVLKSSTLSNP